MVRETAALATVTVTWVEIDDYNFPIGFPDPVRHTMICDFTQDFSIGRIPVPSGGRFSLQSVYMPGFHWDNLIVGPARTIFTHNQ